MAKPQHLVRDARAGDLLEMMLVFAVATILVIRAVLSLTGYPQLGGGGFHIAHMLWGGLGMLISIAVLLSYWNPAVRQIAAALGGIGFGFFIDELGKFITSDNDYFFQPTIAIIYILFILLFIAVRSIHGKTLTAAEVAANREILAAMSAKGEMTRVGRIYERIEESLYEAYARIVSTRWFAPGLSLAFVVVAVTQIASIVSVVTGNDSGSVVQISVVERVASAVSTLFIVLGVLNLRRSRLTAYRWFLRSELVSILVTHVFMFYYSELAALGGLFVHLMVYFALRLLIAGETKASAREV